MAKAKPTLSTTNKDISNMTVYACGGCGVNIGRAIKDLNIDVCFVDGSDSNMKGIDSDKTFLVPEMSGAGKKRLITHEHFLPVAEDVLIKFKPSTTLNVVISSVSGGSGSVAAPAIVKELISRNLPVIVVAIDSRSSVIELQNSVNTLKTYKGVSSVTKKAVSVFYIENNNRKEADQRAAQFINLLTVLTDKDKTEECDVTDLYNFINFDEVTDNKPSVAFLEVGQNEPVNPEKGVVVASTILMTSDRNATIHPVIPEYLSTCIITDQDYKLDDIRIDNTLGRLTKVIDKLETELKQHSDNKKVNKYADLDVDDEIDESGFVV